MMEETYLLNISGQSANLKQSPTGSKDTGIFFPQELIDFLGGMDDLEFVVYKEDCVKAMLQILYILPLYSNKGGQKITHHSIIEEYDRFSSVIDSFFGNNETRIYKGFKPSQTTQSRRYLYGLDYQGFNIRHFLVSDKCQLLFKKNANNSVDLRIVIGEGSLDEDDDSSAPLSTLNPATLTSFNQQLLTAIRTKPFVLLAGISGTGKSRIVRELAKACWPDGDVNRTGHKPENFKMIQVRPNWHDSSEILGYVSRISEGGPEFVVGPFLQAVAEAWKNTERPYFVCLDEMNLAPVEQYFAEYLSVFESREFDGTKYVTDPIIELDDDDLLDQLISHLSSGNADLFNEFHDNGITIPANLVVIGTVNMDETTYSFSRKVLDRAMTIEMNDVDLKAGISGNPKENDFSDVLLSEADVIAPKMSVDDMIDQNPDVSDKVVDYLDDINKILAKTPFRIAFRTRNEAILYVLNMLDLRKDEASGDDAKKDEIIASALGEITMMKILSRIEGDESKISKDKLRQLKERTGQKCREKLDYMIARLDSGFTSFWE